MRWNKADLVLFSLFVLSVKSVPGHLEILSRPTNCTGRGTHGEVRKSSTYAAHTDDAIDIGSSPQETRTFSQVSAVDSIKNLPMAIEFLPFYLKHNINNEKSKMFGYNYEIIFPKTEYLQRKYEPVQNDEISSGPVNAISAAQDSEEDGYHPKSSNTLESFYYNNLPPSGLNGRKSAENEVKQSDSVRVYFDDSANNADGYTRVEASTVDDGSHTTSSDYPSATEIVGSQRTYLSSNGYHYERPASDRRFLLPNNGNQQKASDVSEGERSPSASSVREKIEFPARRMDDGDTLPRVSVRFQSSSFAEDGIPVADNADDNETEPIEYNFGYSLLGDPEFSHEESRQQETIVGAYHVRLPDGRVQLVQYQADQTGYKPKVTYYQTGGPDWTQA